MKDTINKRMVFDRDKAVTYNVIGYIASDYGGDFDRRRSISSYTCAGAISWKA